ncbi:MAG: hypothetical protein H6707_08325 [Deltaproteobacteria bacterium]|nr:hypothetical protein [Deltaproteobacteria bacterium]
MSRSVTIIVCSVWVAACSADGRSNQDASLGDLSPTDAAVIGDGIQRDSLPSEPDLPRYADAAIGDAALTAATVLYAVGPDERTLALRTVESTSASPQSVTGFDGLVDFESLEPTSLHDVFWIDRSKPWVDGGGAAPALRLPGMGALYAYHKRQTGVSGVLIVAADGARTTLFEVHGIYSDIIANQVGVSADQRTVALVARKRELYLARTDGSSLAGGSAAVSLKLPSTVSEVLATSLTFASDKVFFVAEEAAGQRYLYQAPADGSADPKPIALETTVAPRFVSMRLARSTDGTVVALRAGVVAGSTHIYAVNTASGQVRRLSSTLANHAERGQVFGLSGAQLALSADGKRIAFVVFGAQGREVLHVAPTDGTSPPTALDSFFSSDVTRFVNLHFADPQRLVFMAGADDADLSVFQYDFSSGLLVQLGSSASSPFIAGGGFVSLGAWVAPQGELLYVMARGVGFAARLLAYDLKNNTVTTHSIGNISDRVDAVTSCPSTDRVYLVFDVSPSDLLQRQALFELEQNSGRLSALAGLPVAAGTDWRIDRLRLDSGCKRLLWRGFTFVGRAALQTLSLDPLGLARPLTLAPTSFSERALLSRDGKSVFFGSGGGTTTSLLRGQPLAGGPLEVLDPQSGVVEILEVY